jgi:hypothetical protein
MYSAWERPMSKLTDEQLGKFLRIYYQMQLTGDTDVDSEDPMVDMMLEVVREQVTFDVRSYERKCEANKENGEKGGRPAKPEEPNKTQQNPTKPNSRDSDSDTEIDSEIEPEIGIDSERLRSGESKSRTRKRFRPPTVEEVEAYCFERNNKVDAERFVDFYSSNGWKVGKNPMKDWKAAVRTWEKREDNVVNMTAAQQMEAARNRVLDQIIGGAM